MQFSFQKFSNESQISFDRDLFLYPTGPSEPPSNVNATAILSTAIQVTWERVPFIAENGIITQYEIEFNQTTFDEVSMSNVTTVNSLTLEVVITGLEEYVAFFIRVRAYTNVGAGPYSDVETVLTHEDGRHNNIAIIIA